MESHSDDAAPGQEGPAMTNRRERALRAAFALVGALAISACGSARYPAYYTLHFEPSTQAPASERGIGTLAIKELRCPDYLCEGRIVYRPTPAEVGFYQYHRWASQSTGDDCAISRRTRSSAIALRQRIG